MDIFLCAAKMMTARQIALDATRPGEPPARLPLSRSAQLNGDALRDGSHHMLSIRLSNDLLICSIVEFCSLGAGPGQRALLA